MTDATKTSFEAIRTHVRSLESALFRSGGYDLSMTGNWTTPPEDKSAMDLQLRLYHAKTDRSKNSVASEPSEGSNTAAKIFARKWLHPHVGAICEGLTALSKQYDNALK